MKVPMKKIFRWNLLLKYLDNLETIVGHVFSHKVYKKLAHGIQLYWPSTDKMLGINLTIRKYHLSISVFENNVLVIISWIIP